VRRNFWQLVRVKLRFKTTTEVFSQVSQIFPMIVLLPRYLAREVALGGMAQVGGAFVQVNMGLNWFIGNYASLQEFRVVVLRLSQLDAAVDAPRREGENIVQAAVPQPVLCVKDLVLRTPHGRVLTDPLNLRVSPGERWLIRGPSGVGKSTLMRAMAGIWPCGDGRIETPEKATTLFLSQKNYLPPGTLKAALCYPSGGEAFDDADCAKALSDCHLGDYVGSLHEVARWAHRLSPGEQQRVAAARALLHRPDYLFLDESTSAMDPATERSVYDTLIRQLPGTAMLSISHRPALDALHSHFFEMAPATPTRPANAQTVGAT
jgi:putative ATP-binding cassette transporter